MYSPRLFKYRDSYVLYIPTVHAFGSVSLHTLFWYRHTHMTFPPPGQLILNPHLFSSSRDYHLFNSILSHLFTYILLSLVNLCLFGSSDLTKRSFKFSTLWQHTIGGEGQIFFITVSSIRIFRDDLRVSENLGSLGSYLTINLVLSFSTLLLITFFSACSLVIFLTSMKEDLMDLLLFPPSARSSPSSSCLSYMVRMTAGRKKIVILPVFLLVQICTYITLVNVHQ